MGGNHLITFQNFPELPAGDDIGDATILLNAANNDLGHEFTGTANEQLAVLLHALSFADIQHNEIPFGIGIDDFALQGSYPEKQW
jgi:hypothetical protein